MDATAYIACDLGAGSGRVILGRLQHGQLTLEEVHRFVSPPLQQAGTLRWNIDHILHELKTGLGKISHSGEAVASVSVSSWAVDYVLLDACGERLSLPYHYRDKRTETIYKSAPERVGAELIFDETGIQFMPLNTLYQLMADLEFSPDTIGRTDRFLNIADYFHFLFCRVARAEVSMASTTQLYNPRENGWSKKLIKASGIPEKIFPEIVPPGTRLGTLLPALQGETGLGGIDVIASCSHDTGAAVAGIPASGEDWAFISSGTWSLFGTELPAPLINSEVRTHNFTNERGIGSSIRFLKNIAGMWLLQECRRCWQEQGQPTKYDELMSLAAASEPFRSLIHPNDPRFATPDEMPTEIAAFCRETNQLAPQTAGQFVRCILESLALQYRRTLSELESLTGRTMRRLHIVGGGSLSEPLNQFAANATGCTVLAGPVEATAAGNVLIQAITLGHLASFEQGREIVRRSFAIREFRPQQTHEWQQASARFDRMTL